ncbi:MAG: nicotinamide-nucleotide amidohydrolase family protein [Methylotenera sp.]|nr:nicotinamide-nucleotide amidohydrolase family protein [Methylotenera sp.]
MDHLSTLAEELGVALKARGFMLVLAESCTGGMVAQSVTSVAGSSAWFDRGFVTYSNIAKIEMLDVSPQTLEKFGAVSEEVAAQMALGCLKSGTRKNSHLQIAGSITGIAGPDGGTAEKPVGTVCFAWADLNMPILTATEIFAGNRQEIRQQATAFMMVRLIDRLNDLES